jgi:hypothetical protein
MNQRGWPLPTARQIVEIVLHVALVVEDDFARRDLGEIAAHAYGAADQRCHQEYGSASRAGH